jgi:hypothetical protein
MKARFIKPALFVLLGIFLGVYFLQCGNDAGIGSDFDATKYYTKDEIDSMLTQYYQQSEVDTLISKNKSSIISGYIASVGANTTKWFLYNRISDVIEYVSMMVPVNGTITNLCVKPNYVPATGSICVITVLVNYSETSLQITYESTDGTTLKVNSDAITIDQGDIITLQISETNGVDPTNTFHVSCLFDAAE